MSNELTEVQVDASKCVKIHHNVVKLFEMTTRDCYHLFVSARLSLPNQLGTSIKNLALSGKLSKKRLKFGPRWFQPNSKTFSEHDQTYQKEETLQRGQMSKSGQKNKVGGSREVKMAKISKFYNSYFWVASPEAVSIYLQTIHGQKY